MTLPEPSDLLRDLNPQQRRAVTAAPGQVLVLAGPGSGKTRVLTYRIAYLVLSEHVPPTNILAVTFTNKAAREMQHRLEHLLGEQGSGLWLGTFHAICARILRREANFVNEVCASVLKRDPGVVHFNNAFVIMDADDQENLIKRAVKDLRLDEKSYRPAGVHAAISAAKNNLVLPQSYPVQNYRDEVVGRIYQRYQEMLVDNNSLDFDDLLLYAVILLEQHPMLQERYGFRFHHVLVDEFQDTNLAQYKLLQQLTAFRKNLFVVGDEDQSIYRWRGADYRNVLRFEEDFPGCQKILLEQNYRSTQTVLDAARAVIDRNTHRTPKHLFTERGAGERITLYEAVDDHAEAAYVVDTIQKLVQGGKASRADFAVMYRTNAQSRLLEEAFLRAGMPYRLVGAQRFYGRREVKDMIAYLRLVQNPADELSLARVINVPARGIGDKTLVALQLAAQGGAVSAGEVLLDLAARGEDSPFYRGFSGRGALLLADFGGMLAGWRNSLGVDLSLPGLFDRILADIGYQDYLNDSTDEGEERWENVQELRRIAYEFSDRGLALFLENLALVSDQDTLPEQPDAPTLLTLHAAKGLEFSQVFITGLDDGMLPHSRSLDEPEEMAEERRLFYVGLTRARNQLFLVRAERRSTYGSFQDSIPSRFLNDIPEGLLRRQGARMGRAYSSSSSSSLRGGWQERRERTSRWESSDARPSYSAPAPRQPAPPSEPQHRSAPILQPTYQANMRVKHPVWGEGLVVASRVDEGEEVVEIFFDTVGFKRVLAALARLEIL